MTTPLEVETFRFHLTRELIECFGNLGGWKARHRHAAEHAVLVRRDMGEYFYPFAACLKDALDPHPVRLALTASDRLARHLEHEFGDDVDRDEIDLGWSFEAGLAALLHPIEHYAFKLALLKAAGCSVSAREVFDRAAKKKTAGAA